jgi:hypothetical protein
VTRPVLKRALADVVTAGKLEDTVVLLIDVEVVSIMCGPVHNSSVLAMIFVFPESLLA